MKIVVLVKEVPEELAKVGLTPSRTLDRGSGGSVTDPVGKNAVEAAVRLKEEVGGSVTALTLGPAGAEKVLKECVSAGADTGVLVSDESLVGSDVYGTADALAKAIVKCGPFDLVLAGARSFDGATAAVGPMVAELLGVPQVTNVTGIETRGDDLVCKQVLDGGHAMVQVSLPAVVTVDDYINTPRYPTVRSKLAANKATFEVLTASDLGVAGAGLGGARVRVETAEPPAPRQAGVTIAGDTPEQVAENLVAALADAGVL